MASANLNGAFKFQIDEFQKKAQQAAQTDDKVLDKYKQQSEIFNILTKTRNELSA